MSTRILMIALLMVCGSVIHAQSISGAVIVSIGGQFKNGNLQLQFTLGETAVGAGSNGNVRLGTGFWTVVPPGYTSTAKTVYRFTGNGQFSLSANWEGGLVPPNPLPANSEIIINPTGADAKCIINIPFQLAPGSKVSVVAGKQVIVSGK